MRFGYVWLLGLLLACSVVGTCGGAVAGEYGGVITPPSTSPHDSAWVLVELGADFTNPVLFGGVPSDGGQDEMVVRFRNLRRGRDCEGWCFELRAEEPTCRDGVQDGVRVGWLALEAGVFHMATDGDPSDLLHYEVGKAVVQGGTYTDISYDPYFAGRLRRQPNPCVITHAQTRNIDTFVKTRQMQRQDREPGFAVTLEDSAGMAHGSEVVGWLSAPAGSGTFGGHAYRADIVTDLVAHQSRTLDFQSSFRDMAPYIFGTLASAEASDQSVLRVYDLSRGEATVYVGEQQCPRGSGQNDRHADQNFPRGSETVHYLALPGILGHANIVAAHANVPALQTDTSLDVAVSCPTPYLVFANGLLVGAGQGGNATWAIHQTSRSASTVIGFVMASSADGFTIDIAVNGISYAAAVSSWTCSDERALDSADWMQPGGVLGSSWADAHVYWPPRGGSARIRAAKSANSSVACRFEVPMEQTFAGGVAMGEEGSLVISTEWRTVELRRHYTQPVVLAGIPSYLGTEEAAVVRVRNIRHGADGCQAWCFDIRLQEPPCLDDRHGEEFVGWLVIEAGAYLTDEGHVFQAGVETIEGQELQPVAFPSTEERAADDVVILTQLQTCADEGFTQVRHQSHDSLGFKMALLKIRTVTPASPTPQHVLPERVGWLAFPVGSGHLGGAAYVASNVQGAHQGTLPVFDVDFGNQFSIMPIFLGATRSFNDDRTHDTLQIIGAATTKNAHLLPQAVCSQREYNSAQTGNLAVGFLALQPASGTLHAKETQVTRSWADLAGGTEILDLAQTAFMRFRNLQVDRESPILDVRVRVLASQTGTSEQVPNILVRAFDVDNCTSTLGEHEPRTPMTAAFVQWVPWEWHAEHEYWSPNLAPIVKELVHRFGWTHGNAACFVFITNATVASRPAFAIGTERHHAPYVSIVTAACADVDCGAQGYCASGKCSCINDYFGDRCEIPPGPPTLCEPIKERYFALVEDTCVVDLCGKDCIQAVMPLIAGDQWPWARYSTMCNLGGALGLLGYSSDCQHLSSTNSSAGEDFATLAKPCGWQDGYCVAPLDEAIMAAVGPRFGTKGSGLGFQACFESANQDMCEMMSWCWWQALKQSCAPRTHSMMTVALAALSQWDSMYDATLDPHGQLLHLADECGRHSEQACEISRGCVWQHTPFRDECEVVSDVVQSLMQPPSCSAAWTQAASCRGRGADECVAGCSWSGAAESCMLSAQITLDKTSAPCADKKECLDDAWGIASAAGLTCQDLLTVGTCSFDLQGVFSSLPPGLTVASICQASCGECGDPCVDSESCINMQSLWSYNNNGGCSGTVNSLAAMCPKTCGLCAQRPANVLDDLGDESDGAPTTSHIVMAEREVAAALGGSVSAVHDASTRQMQYGVGSVVSLSRLCRPLTQPNCSTSLCDWDTDTSSCKLRHRSAMQSFLGNASTTPLGRSLLSWLDATAVCPHIHDSASCESAGKLGDTAPSGHGERGGILNFGKYSDTLLPISAGLLLLTLWAFGALVLGRHSAKKHKTESESLKTFEMGTQATFGDPIDGMPTKLYANPYGDQVELSNSAVPQVINDPNNDEPWDTDGYKMPGIPEFEPRPSGLEDECVPWDDFDMDGGPETLFQLPLLDSHDPRAERCAKSTEPGSPWDGSSSDAESYGTGVYSSDGSPADNSDSTPDTEVGSGCDSTPPDAMALRGAVSRAFHNLDPRPVRPEPEGALVFNCVQAAAIKVESYSPPSLTFGFDAPAVKLEPSTHVGSASALVAAAARLPSSAGSRTASGPGRGEALCGSRKRKLTDQKKEAVTATVYMLCRSQLFGSLQELQPEVLRSRFDVEPEENGFAKRGALLCYGQDSNRTKLVLAMALNDIFHALQWDLAQPVENPVKWGTVRRDVLWGYKKREGASSVYLFDMSGVALDKHVAAIEARLPMPIDQLLQHTFRRAASVNAKMEADANASGNLRPVYRCEVEGCEYSSTERRYFMGHMRVHRGHKPFRCKAPGCEYASYSSQHVTRHARVHSGERPFKCTWEGCDYAAAQKAHLQSHMLKHTGQRPFKCTFPGCEFACTRSWHLDRHMRKHDEPAAANGGRDLVPTPEPDTAAPDGWGTGSDLANMPWDTHVHLSLPRSGTPPATTDSAPQQQPRVRSV